MTTCPHCGGDLDAGTALIYSATGLPEGASVNAATGQISWVPGPGQAGEYTGTYMVSDGLAQATRTALIKATLAPV